MDNSYTGDVELALGDKSYQLRYDWRALGALRTLLGKGFMNALDQKLVEAAEDPGLLADIMAAGLKELDADAILDLSPPIAASVEAVGKALAYAFFGPKGPPAARPPKAG